jgi:hypothetical protein
MKADNFVFKLSGGLGNQLFQFSAGRFLAEKRNCIVEFEFDEQGVFHEDSYLSSFLNIGHEGEHPAKSRRLVLAVKRGHSFLGRRNWIYRKISELLSLGYFSPSIGFDAHLERVIRGNCVYGYFQSYLYAETARNEIIAKLATEENSLNFSKLVELSQQINPIMIHIRRGDYLDHRNTLGLLSHHYFSRAISEATKGDSTRMVWVFTDDKADSIRLLNYAGISVNRIFSGEDEMTLSQTLKLISTGREIIISNSTFSWWAAFLGSESAKIFYPSRWYRALQDPEFLIPNSWSPIESSWEN